MAQISQVVFGKSLTDLVYQDIVTFFTTDHAESNTIEFKAFSAQHGSFNNNLKGIIRAICGFLNSDGGLAIWGAPLGVNDPETGEKKSVGPLAPVPDYKEKDWLINKISDSITPLPVGIKVCVLQNLPTENVYIFEVPASPYKPHQYDNTYYVRLDGQTKPAPHYFIEALFKRISYPNIEGYLKVIRAGLKQNPSRYYVEIGVFLFNFSQLQNEEMVMARITSIPGRFRDYSGAAERHEVVRQIGMLHFGLVHNHTELITVDPEEINNNNMRLHLVLTYSGKHSPAKSSDYTLDLHNLDLQNPLKTTNLIESCEENILYSERQEKLGTNREKTLLMALGRIPSQSDNSSTS